MTCNNTYNDYECNDCGGSGGSGGSCGSGGSGGGDCPSEIVYVSSVSVSPSSVYLNVGEWYYSASAYAYPWNADNRNITWYSANPSIASVNASNGYIYANSTGTTRIYAAAVDGSGCSDYLTVTVSHTVAVTSVTLNRNNLSLEKGQSTTLSATICPSNASNKSLCWSSSNPCVATVCNGLVTAVSRGSATITATAQDGSGACDCCTVSVTEDILVTSVCVSPATKTMVRGTAGYIYATVFPTNATNQSVQWSSSNSCVATVNPVSGMVYAQGAGTAHIYATACDGSGVRGSCRLTVNEPILVQNITLNHTSLSLYINSSELLEACICPENATFDMVRWSSSNENVATVSTNGIVVAKSQGTATITASTYDDSGVTATCRVTVLPIAVNCIQLNKSKAYLGKDETLQLQYSTCPRNATVSSVVWESYPSYVASVSSTGVVTAHTDGVATVTVRVNGTHTATCQVTVDTREKVTVENVVNVDEDDCGEYVKITFEDGNVWKCIGCDLSLEGNRSGENMGFPNDYRDSLNYQERRYVDNVEVNFSVTQLAFIYRLDPLGIEYYMKTSANDKVDGGLKELLLYKDEVYRAIFGNPVPDSFYFRIVNGEVRYGTYEGADRTQIYSNAEILFGTHNSFSWDTFAQTLLTGLFNMLPGVSAVQTGVQIYQALFHSGSFTGLYSSQAKEYVEDYVTAPISQVVTAKLGSRATKCIFWAGNLLSMLAGAALDSFTIPNLNDMVIYNTVENQTYYNVIFKGDDDNVQMKEIIDACE